MNITRTEQEQKLIHTYMDYCNLGTLKKVGKKLKISKEAVRQRLVNGTNLDLFNYNTNKKIAWLELKLKISQTTLTFAIRDFGSVAQVAKHYKISRVFIKKLLKTYNITPAQLGILKKTHRKLKCLSDYRKFSLKSFGDASTSELQSTKKGRAIYARILRVWPSFGEFKEDYEHVDDNTLLAIK